MAVDAIVKIIKIAICGSNAHILTDDALTCTPRVLGHEEVGAIDSIGGSVTAFHPGGRVLRLETC